MHQPLCIMVLFAVSTSTLSHLLPEFAVLENCKTHLEITQDLLDELYTDPEPLLKNPETRCFAACFLTENTTMNPDGTLNAARVIETMPMNIINREEVIEAFKSCANEKGEDSCETAYKTVVCIRKNDVIREIRRYKLNGEMN